MLIGILLTNILVHYIRRQFKVWSTFVHHFVKSEMNKCNLHNLFTHLFISLTNFLLSHLKRIFFEYIYIHAYILMQILFTHALNCLGMVVALMSHDNLQSWPWPKRFQRDQQPPHLIYWQTLLRHHVNQWEIFGGCNVGGLPSATHKASHPQSPQSFGGPVFREFVV